MLAKAPRTPVTVPVVKLLPLSPSLSHLTHPKCFIITASCPCSIDCMGAPSACCKWNISLCSTTLPPTPTTSLSLSLSSLDKLTVHAYRNVDMNCGQASSCQQANVIVHPINTADAVASIMCMNDRYVRSPCLPIPPLNILFLLHSGM